MGPEMSHIMIGLFHPPTRRFPRVLTAPPDGCRTAAIEELRVNGAAIRRALAERSARRLPSSLQRAVPFLGLVLVINNPYLKSKYLSLKISV